LINTLFFFGNITSQIFQILIFILSSFGYGSLLLRTIGLNDRRHFEYFIYSIALGFGVLGHVTLALGFVGLINKPTAAIIISFGLLLALFEVIKNKSAYHIPVIHLLKSLKFSWFSTVLIIILLTNLIYPLFANALVPPYNYDAAAYHLAIPKIFIQQNSINYISFIPHSNWPLETELLFTLSLLIASETVAQLITWITLILVCISLFYFGKKWFNSEVGLLAAVIFSSTPMVTTLAGTGLIELPLTLYTLLAIITFLEWLNSGERHNWILSAIFGGLAASTKLNGALVPLILGILLVYVILTRNQGNKLKMFVFYGLIAFSVVSPWYLKTWVQTGNPFWPFLFDIFGGRNWDELGTEYLLGFIRLPNLELTMKNWLLGGYLLTFEAIRFGPYRVTLGPFYLLFIPFSIPALFRLGPKERRILIWLLLIGFMLYTIWFLQTHQTRFLMPASTVLALISAIGLWWFWNLGSRWWPTISKTILIILLVYFNWLTNPADRNQVKNSWLFLSDQMTRDQFLESVIPGFEVFSFANTNLADDAYIWMALYESRGYYLDREYMWANPISQRDIQLEKFMDASKLAEELHQRGFTHIIFRTDQLEALSYIRYGPELTELTRNLLSEHAQLIYQSTPLELYELLQ
jgi:4-amino-4-deoxy-L-arabinose transferase-like glycosyltransferase